MATPPIASSRLLENPLLNASPTRYSTNDVGAAAVLNSTSAHFADFIPFVQIDSDRFNVLGHDPIRLGARFRTGLCQTAMTSPRLRTA